MVNIVLKVTQEADTCSISLLLVKHVSVYATMYMHIPVRVFSNVPTSHIKDVPCQDRHSHVAE